MGYLLHILLAVGLQGLAESGAALPVGHPWLLPALAAVPHLLGWGVHRASLRGRFRRADALHHVLVWSPPALHFVAVSAGGWMALVETRLGVSPRLLDWPHPAQLLGFAPFLVYGLLAIDARARVGGSAAVPHLRRFQARMFLSALVPVALYVVVTWLAGLVPGVRVRVEEVAVWSALFTTAVALGFLAILPWVLCNTWETVPLGPGVQRSLLESVARRAGFRCRELLVWRTGNLLANAAIVGVHPRGRFVLFSDSLLAQLPLRELAAVFAHEIGHARRRHVLVFVAWSAAFFLAADLIAAALFPDSELGLGAVLVLVLGAWYALLGYLSRRFELEADLESYTLTGDADALVSALELVGGVHSRRDSSWRHFSTGDRVAFLREVQRDPRAGDALRRGLRRWSVVGWALAAVLAALEVASLSGSWPEDRVRVALREGDYAGALARADAHELPDELELLVRRGAQLADAGDATPGGLEASARAALRAGDVELAIAALDLATLRGRDDLRPVRDAVALAADGRTEEARGLAAGRASSWRGELDSFLARSPRIAPGSAPAR